MRLTYNQQYSLPKLYDQTALENCLHSTVSSSRDNKYCIVFYSRDKTDSTREVVSDSSHLLRLYSKEMLGVLGESCTGDRLGENVGDVEAGVDLRDLNHLVLHPVVLRECSVGLAATLRVLQTSWR